MYEPLQTLSRLDTWNDIKVVQVTKEKQSSMTRGTEEINYLVPLTRCPKKKRKKFTFKTHVIIAMLEQRTAFCFPDEFCRKNRRGA